MKSQSILKYLQSLNSSLEISVENSTLYYRKVMFFVQRKDFPPIASDQ